MASLIKKEKASITERLAIIDSISDKVNKKYNKTIMGRIGNNEEILNELTIDFIPSPSITFNTAVGGGIPRKRCTIIAGKENSGKTSFALETIAINMNPLYNEKANEFVACWLETENSLEKDYICNTFKINPDRFIFIKFDHNISAEEALDLIQTILATATVDFFVINSLKCLIPSAELESSLASQQVGLAARMNSKMARKLNTFISDSDAAFVLITHLTTEISSLAMDKLTIPGGTAIKHWSNLTLDFRQRSIGPGDPITKEEGIKVAVTVKKNRCVLNENPFKKFEYYAIFGEGIEQYLTALEQAIELGIVEARGAWIYWMKDGEIYEKFNGKQAYREYMKNNPEKWKEFSSLLDPKKNIQDLTEEEIEEIKLEEALEEQPPTKKGAKKKTKK